MAFSRGVTFYRFALRGHSCFPSQTNRINNSPLCFVTSLMSQQSNALPAIVMQTAWQIVPPVIPNPLDY